MNELEDKRIKLDIFLCNQNCSHKKTKNYMEYIKWFANNTIKDEDILKFIPLTYEEWKNK